MAALAIGAGSLKAGGYDWEAEMERQRAQWQFDNALRQAEQQRQMDENFRRNKMAGETRAARSYMRQMRKP